MNEYYKNTNEKGGEKPMDAVWLTAEELKNLRCKGIIALQNSEGTQFPAEPRNCPRLHLTANRIPNLRTWLLSCETNDFYVQYDWKMQWTEAEFAQLNTLTAKLRHCYRNAEQIAALPEMFQLQLPHILFHCSAAVALHIRLVQRSLLYQTPKSRIRPVG